jgi:L-Ala-D/L-Glu epimerase / N-acetyl-D-glutamate racemase
VKLILFDVDGTLLTMGRAARDAFAAALSEAAGRPINPDGYSFSGRTDPQIARDILTLHGVAGADLEAAIPETIRRYVALISEGDRHLRDARLLPGVRELLAELARRRDARLALLTGNVEAGARVKVGHFGLQSYFDFSVSCFGSDDADRYRLPALALRRARALLWERAPSPSAPAGPPWSGCRPCAPRRCCPISPTPPAPSRRSWAPRTDLRVAGPRKGRPRITAPRGRSAKGRGRAAPPRSGPLRFEHRPVELHLRHAWALSRNRSTVKTNLLTRLTQGGIEGWGEAAPNVRYNENAGTVATALELARRHLGDDASRLDAILDRIDRVLPGHHAARAAIDIALHDWIGRRDGVPLYRMFGADPERAPHTSFSIGLDTVEVMQAKVREAEGFPILKIKVGTDRDREVIEAIRAVTDRPLFVDANEGWTDRAAAVEIIRWMQGMGVVLVEQPLPAADLEGARFVRERVEVPLFADEAVLTIDDLPRLAGAYDGINVKLQKAGGLRMARRMIDAARRRGLRVMLGCMIESSIGITAAAHLSPLVDHADLDGNLLIADDPFRGARVRQGRLVLPDRPGLGVQGSW